jgi:hypothetical protein
MPNEQEVYREEYKHYLMGLFSDAWKNDPLSFIYTLLRVTGVHYGHWDPYVEMLRAFDDYNSILNFANTQGGNTSLRIALLMYCQSIEMSAVHEVLANLLRCKGGRQFVVRPFIDLQKSKGKNVPFTYIPPSANSKIKRLKQMALEVNDNNFKDIIDSFYDDQVRNSFVHSDYCLTDSEYRWTEGGPPASKSLDYISEIITRSFAFYEALFQTWGSWLQWFKKHPRYIKLPQYEVLELITNENGLYGFAIHFSNGNKAYFERHDDYVDSRNLTLNHDGTVNFFVGDLAGLERAWKVDGQYWSDEFEGSS